MSIADDNLDEASMVVEMVLGETCDLWSGIEDQTDTVEAEDSCQRIMGR